MRPRPAIFFTHIPRSGGTSLIRALAEGVPEARQFPNRLLDPDLFTAKVSVAYLLDQTPARLEATDFFCPHMPHGVAELLGLDLFTVTLIREPVERVRSVLDLMATDTPDDDHALERIWAENNWANGWYTTHQLCFYLGFTPTQVRELASTDAKAGTADLGVEFSRRVRAIAGSDADLVAAACRTLESIDALGLTDHSDDLVKQLEMRFGAFTSGSAERANQGQGSSLPAGLRRQIEDVTAADREIYEFAVALVAQRAAVRH